MTGQDDACRRRQIAFIKDLTAARCHTYTLASRRNYIGTVLLSGQSQLEVAKHYGVSRASVSQAIRPRFTDLYTRSPRAIREAYPLADLLPPNDVAAVLSRKGKPMTAE